LITSFFSAPPLPFRLFFSSRRCRKVSRAKLRLLLFFFFYSPPPPTVLPSLSLVSLHGVLRMLSVCRVALADALFLPPFLSSPFPLPFLECEKERRRRTPSPLSFSPLPPPSFFRRSRRNLSQIMTTIWYDSTFHPRSFPLSFLLLSPIASRIFPTNMSQVVLRRTQIVPRPPPPPSSPPP